MPRNLMSRAMKFLGQGVAYLALAVVLGYFSNSPAYIRLAPDTAVMKLSISHGGKHKGECDIRQFAGIKETRTTRRALQLCPRERHPVLVEILLNGELIFSREQPPSGLSSDGPSYFYERITVPAGHHRLDMRMRDSGRAEGFDYETTQEVDLEPTRNLAVVFSTPSANFVIK